MTDLMDCMPCNGTGNVLSGARCTFCNGSGRIRPVSEYPAIQAIERAIEEADAAVLREAQVRNAAVVMGITFGQRRRKARLPKWSGQHGSVVKGSVRFDFALGWVVVYSYLLGYETTAKASETFGRWSLAIGQYREHDRMVRERKRLEDFRAVRVAK